MSAILLEAGGHIDINCVWSKALRLSNNIYLHAKPGMRIHSRICHLRKVVLLHKSLLVFFCFCSFYSFLKLLCIYFFLCRCLPFLWHISEKNRQGLGTRLGLAAHTVKWQHELGMKLPMTASPLLGQRLSQTRVPQHLTRNHSCLFIIMQIEPLLVLLIYE